MTTATLQRGTAKDRILEAAENLFYVQGYNSTGVQQIIDEANTSKGTFYTHFKTKDDLGLAYLRKRSAQELTRIKQFLSTIADPLEQYYAFNSFLKEWMQSTNYRGCAFTKMTADVIDPKSPIRKEAKYHYESFRAIIKDFVEELLKSNKKYAHLDTQYITDQYMMIQVGALTNSEIYQDLWPYDHAAKAIKQLIGE